MEHRRPAAKREPGGGHPLKFIAGDEAIIPTAGGARLLRLDCESRRRTSFALIGVNDSADAIIVDQWSDFSSLRLVSLKVPMKLLKMYFIRTLRLLKTIHRYFQEFFM